MATETIAERLNLADLALNNAAQPEIAPLLAAHSYDAACLAEGRALWNAARQLLSQRALLYGRQQELSRQLDQIRRAALRALDRWMSQFCAVARVTLRDCPQYLEELGISVRS